MLESSGECGRIACGDIASVFLADLFDVNSLVAGLVEKRSLGRPRERVVKSSSRKRFFFLTFNHNSEEKKMTINKKRYAWPPAR